MNACLNAIRPDVTPTAGPSHMEPHFSPAELEMLGNIPDADLVSLAAELDILVPEEIDREQLAGRCLVAIAERAQKEGLPFSRFDRADLEDLQPHELAAIAKLCKAKPTVDHVLKKGGKIYRWYAKRRPRSQVAILLPSLLVPLARMLAGSNTA